MVLPDFFKSEVQDSLVINASKKKVFEALTRWNDYPEWNPYITKIEGDPRTGEEIKVFFNMGFGPALPLKCRVDDVDAQKATLSWEYHAAVPWIYAAQHTFAIEEINPGQCQIVQREKMQGLFGNRLQWFLHNLMKKRFHAMHEALRLQVERTAA
jgi:hypothetical protein